jgi:hypothetical protein
VILVRQCILSIAFLAFPVSLFGWGSIGHMTVAYVAYQELGPNAKVRVMELLKLNPDYANWEKQIPAGISAEDHDRFLFMMASTWADDIKWEPQYSDDGSDGGNTPNGASSVQNIGYSDRLRHKYWHFIDTPFSPDKTALPSIPTPNAQTQIIAFRAVLASSQSDELKSYDLVWLLHLVGDVHQPLHTVTRVTQAHPKGDAGGNLVKLFGDAVFNLHGYWDDLPGSDCKFCADKLHCAHRAMVLAGTLPPVPTKVASNLDTVAWVHEGFDYAQTRVYRDPIGAADQAYTIVPDSGYERDAYRLAKSRMAAAGARLARILNTELK